MPVCCCNNAVPMALSDASVWRINRFVSSGNHKIGELGVVLTLPRLFYKHHHKPRYSDYLHVKSHKGAAFSEKFGINFH